MPGSVVLGGTGRERSRERTPGARCITSAGCTGSSNICLLPSQTPRGQSLLPRSNIPGMGFKALSIHYNATFYPNLNQNSKGKTVQSLGIKYREPQGSKGKSPQRSYFHMACRSSFYRGLGLGSSGLAAEFEEAFILRVMHPPASILSTECLLASLKSPPCWQNPHLIKVRSSYFVLERPIPYKSPALITDVC